MINGENFGWEVSNDKVLTKAEIKALSRNRLFHYTSFRTLKRIIKNKEILFNQISRVNDGKEAKLFNNSEVSKLVFVSCFTHLNTESIPMWYIYGKNNKQRNGNDTVRIEFKFKTTDIISSFIDECRASKNSTDKNIIWWKSIRSGIHPKIEWYYHIKTSDVVYRIQEIEKHPIKNNEIYSLSSMGRIKRKEWQYEKETRLILVMRTLNSNISVPNIDYFLIPIKFCNLEMITVTFNPWMESGLKEKIKHFFSTVKEFQRLGIQTKFYDSILTGELPQ